MQAYHDTEWGVPHHDDRALFELLTLEGAQAGLSWRTVLVRRDAYRQAYHGFDIERVAAMTDAELETLLADFAADPQPAEDLLGPRKRPRRAGGDRRARQPGSLPVVLRQPHTDPQRLGRPVPGARRPRRFPTP